MPLEKVILDWSNSGFTHWTQSARILAIHRTTREPNNVSIAWWFLLHTHRPMTARHGFRSPICVCHCQNQDLVSREPAKTFATPSWHTIRPNAFKISHTLEITLTPRANGIARSPKLDFVGIKIKCEQKCHQVVLVPCRLTLYIGERQHDGSFVQHCYAWRLVLQLPRGGLSPLHLELLAQGDCRTRKMYQVV